MKSVYPPGSAGYHQRKPGKKPGFWILAALLFLLVLNGCTRSTPVPKPTTSSAPQDLPVRVEPTKAGRPTETEPAVPEANFTPTPGQPTPTTTNTPVPEPEFCTPLQDHTLQDLQEIITQAFLPPPPGKDTGHHGMDFAYYRRGGRLSIAGVLIQSVLKGKVASVLENEIPYGNMIMVESRYQDIPGKVASALGVTDSDSLYVLYAHMGARSTLNIGDSAACGQVLGEVGNTPKGWSSDPHLHLEARVGPPGAVFDGMVYYDTRAKPEEMANYERWRMSGEFVLVDPLMMLEVGMEEKLRDR